MEARPRIYLMGYTGRKPGDILTIAEQLDALVCDIRYSPFSRVPCWQQQALIELLGHRYRHIREFGNTSYKTGGINIANIAAGERMLRGLSNTVILLCACKDAASCHRTVIGKYLTEHGYTVSEYQTPEPVTGDLFA